MPERILDTTTVGALADIMHAAQSNASVARVREALPDGVVRGTARSIGHLDSTFAGKGVDIRDLYLRVTLSTGLDEYWPIGELVPEVLSGYAAMDYRS